MNIHAEASKVFKEAKRHTRRKLLPLKSLEKKLDRVFSEYIRRRDADEGGTVKCCTCTRLMFWRDSQCGHYIKRQHRSVRWDERNAGPQCPADNLYRSGAMDEMAQYIIDRYGVETHQELMKLKHSTRKFSRAELEEMCNHFQQKLSELER